MGNLPFYFKDVRYTAVRRTCYLSAKIVATRDISDKLKVTFIYLFCLLYNILLNKTIKY